MPTIDEALRDQERLHSTLLATLEPIPDDKEHVRGTPYVRGRGCLCQSAIHLRKQDIEEVQPTSIEVTCCGKQLQVFRVYLKPDAQVPGTELVRHVMSSVRSTATATAPGTSCDCEALFDMLSMLQEDLRRASPGEKAALIRRIRKVWDQIDSCGC